MVEPWASIELDGNFLLMVDELKSVDADNSVDKITPEAAEKTAQFEQESVDLEALGIIHAIQFALRKFVHKKITFEKELIDDAIKNFKPLLLKYGVLLPSWIEQYQEEIMALKSLGSLGKNAYDQAKRYKKEDALLLAKRQDVAA